MVFNDTKRPARPDQRQASGSQIRAKIPTMRLPSISRRGILAAIMASVCVLAAGLAVSDDDPPPAVPKIDAKALATLVQSFDKVEEQKHPWGWIRWLMNSKIDPKAGMTFGIVQINPAERNPLHVHGNCEEILYVLSGSCEHQIGNQTAVLKPETG